MQSYIFDHRYSANICLHTSELNGILCPMPSISLKLILSGQRLLSLFAPFLSTQSYQPPQIKISLGMPSVINGYNAILGRTLGSKNLKNRDQLPSGSKISVYMILVSISCCGSVKGVSFKLLFKRDCLQQLQMVRRGDLYVRLNAHPNLFSKVQNTSPIPLMPFLQSYSFGVIPIAESSKSYLIWALAYSGCLMQYNRRRYELKECPIKVQFLCLQKPRSASMVLKKNFSIQFRSSSGYQFNLVAKPIPRISQKITFPFLSRCQMLAKPMRALPPKPWLRQQFSQFFLSAPVEGTKTVQMNSPQPITMLNASYFTFRKAKISFSASWTRREDSLKALQVTG